MQQVTTVGRDLAKSLFQVHGVDAQGRPVLKRRLSRAKVLEFFATLPACLVGLEACAAAHYWARELAKFGHTVRLADPVRPAHFAASRLVANQFQMRRPIRSRRPLPLHHRHSRNTLLSGLR